MDWSCVSIEEIVTHLELEAHPEGGWFKRTWTSPAEAEGRPLASSILFLLPAGVTSQWHRVDADELWIHRHGDPLDLSIAAGDTAAAIDRVTVGPVSAIGHHPQHTVPAGAWQSAVSQGRYTLVSCVVVPGFVWEGFELAPEGWAPGRSS
jgi:predicted cupin superfamily sugar epimerase